MTPTSQRNLWNSLLKLKAQPYWDNRKGLVYWTYPELRKLFLKLVVQYDAGSGIGMWNILMSYKNKITSSYMRKIFQNIFLKSVNVTADVLSVAEGGTVTFTVTTVGYDDQQFHWTLEIPPGSTFTAQDFTDDADNGEFSIVNGTGTFTRSIKVDSIFEDPEFFYLNIRRHPDPGGPVPPVEFYLIVAVTPIIATPDIATNALVFQFVDATRLPFDYTNVNDWNIELGLNFRNVYYDGTNTMIYLTGATTTNAQYNAPNIRDNDSASKLIRIIDNGNIYSDINSTACQDCIYLEEINFPSVTTVNYKSFAGCNRLTTITLPQYDSLTSDIDAFLNITGNNITLSIPGVNMINGVNNTPARDIRTLIDNNNITLIDTTENPSPIVGDYYRGGILVAADSTHYYIVANYILANERSTTFPWATDYSDILTCDTIDCVIPNMQALISQYGSAQDYAAGYLNHNAYLGYNDWCLPTPDLAELVRLNTTLSAAIIEITGDFGYRFWTSSQFNTNDAKMFQFNNSPYIFAVNKPELQGTLRARVELIPV